ncbi:glycosyltransferase [Microbacterium sp.]|uniref:glycosyltransferase n=1 Tax=Microbacterium sp. TaxID=51671 RepID=UPI003735935D
MIHLQTPWPARAKFLAYYGGPVRRAVRRAGVVLTVSETSARAIRSWVGDDRIEVVNAGNGCSAAFVAAGPSAVADHPYLLFVGNTRRHKNLEVVFRAMASARGIRLRAVVPESEASAVARMAEAFDVSGHVEVWSGVDDEGLAALYRGAAATVMPSTLEGFGLPALESISCGTPVIHWRECEAVAEIVEGRGWAVDDAHDPREWSSILGEAIAAATRVDPPVGRYDWARTAATVSAVLARAAA